MTFSKSFYRRQRLANFLGRWSDRWLLTRKEIIEWNEYLYECARDEAGLP